MLSTNHRYLPSLLLLVMLVALDAIMMAIHTFLYYGLNLTGPMWDVTFDGGYPEFLQYAKFAWVVVLLVVAARTRSALTLLFWIPLFVYLALDDALEIHEKVGEQLATSLDLPAAIGLRPVDFGELLVGGTVILFGLALIIVGFVRSRPMVRRMFVDILLLIGVLAFFAIAVDMVHSFVNGTGLLDNAVGLFEDSGEMIAASLIVVYLFHITLGHDTPRILARVRQSIPGVDRIGLESSVEEPMEVIGKYAIVDREPVSS